MFWPAIYIALTALVHGAILVTYMTVPALQSAPVSMFFFLGGFLLALASAAWPGLRPRHMFFLLPVLAMSQGLISLVLEQVAHGAGLRLDGDAGNAVIASVLIQAFITLVSAAALWMKGRQRRFVVRRAAMDREELETLVANKEERAPEPNLTFLRYSLLIKRGLSFVGALDHRILYQILAFQRRETIYLHDFLWMEDDETRREETLDRFLRRAELHQGAKQFIFLVGADDFWTGPRLERYGFRRIPSEDIDRMLEIRRDLDRVLKDEFPDWKPFGAAATFYEYDLKK